MSATQPLAEKIPSPAITSMAEDDLLDLQTELGKAMGRCTQQIQRMRSNLTRVKNELRLRREGGRERGEMIVSDHAVVRYLERHKKFDVAAIRDEIRTVAKRSKSERMEKRQGERLVDNETGLTMVYTHDRNSIATILSDTAESVLDGAEIQNP